MSLDPGLLGVCSDWRDDTTLCGSHSPQASAVGTAGPGMRQVRGLTHAPDLHLASLPPSFFCLSGYLVLHSSTTGQTPPLPVISLFGMFQGSQPHERHQCLTPGPIDPAVSGPCSFSYLVASTFPSLVMLQVAQALLLLSWMSHYTAGFPPGVLSPHSSFSHRSTVADRVSLDLVPVSLG